MNISQSFGQIDRDLKEFVNQKTKEIEQKAKQQVASKIPAMQNEVYAQYSIFIPKYISKYFASIYGATNYDEDSLVKSLSLKKNGLRPDFSYDSKKFKWSKDVLYDTDNFNQNSTNTDYILNPTDFMDNIEYQEYIENDDSDKEIRGYTDYSVHNAKQQFSYYNKINRQGAYLNLDEAYKKAYTEANKSFDKKMYTEIIPKLYQKYGIKLN